MMSENQREWWTKICLPLMMMPVTVVVVSALLLALPGAQISVHGSEMTEFTMTHFIGGLKVAGGLTGLVALIASVAI